MSIFLLTMFRFKYLHAQLELIYLHIISVIVLHPAHYKIFPCFYRDFYYGKIYYQYPKTLKNGLNQTFWGFVISDAGEERALVERFRYTHFPRNKLFHTSMNVADFIPASH